MQATQKTPFLSNDMVLLHNLAIRPIPKMEMLFQIGHCEHQDTHETGERVLGDLNQRFSRAMH